MPRSAPTLVTGASGCIGGRLVEKLVLERRAPVRALVRSWSRAIRLARFDIDIHRGDIGNPEDLDSSVQGCAAVVHCAHDWEDAEKNLAAAQALLAACARHGVGRLVFVGSLAVYEPLPPGELDEDAPRVLSGSTYSDTKIELERLFEQAQVPSVVVEPTVVYGPYSEPWTHAPIERLRTTRLVLPDEPGICNAVYVDDVADSLILATEAESFAGARVLVSGPETVDWRRFFGAYEDMLGVSSVTLVPAAELEDDEARAPAWRDPRGLLQRGLPSRAMARIRPLLPAGFRKAFTSRMPAPMAWPSEQELALFRATTTVKIDRARRVLGYEPRVSFDEGMALTGKYVAWAGL